MDFDAIKSLLDSTKDPEMKLEMIMDIGKELTPIPVGKKGILISGCASRVEIFKDESGKLYASADSAIVRGLVRILIAIKESNANFDEFSKLNINLGASRLTGTAEIIAFLEAL